MTKISARVVADSKNEFGNRITTMEVIMPRFILAEFNTHRMFSRNSASSRAIPFEKMVKMVEENPFVPIAWQKDHKGMQGSEYFQVPFNEDCLILWYEGKDKAVNSAKELHSYGVTKQLANRLLEPFMYHKVLVTATEWENFFALRCPQYRSLTGTTDGKFIHYRSWKDYCKANNYDYTIEGNIIDRLNINKGQSEIHMMALAEAMWDAYNESTPKLLKAGEWHIPFGDNMTPVNNWGEMLDKVKVKISTARCARISYTTIDDSDPKNLKVGDKFKCTYFKEDENFEIIKTIEHDAGIKDGQCNINGFYIYYDDICEVVKPSNYENDIKLHDRLLESGHMSPAEHCARAMNKEEYMYNILGEVNHMEGENIKHEDSYSEDLCVPIKSQGWSGNFRGFIQYRKLVEKQ